MLGGRMSAVRGRSAQTEPTIDGEDAMMPRQNLWQMQQRGRMVTEKNLQTMKEKLVILRRAEEQQMQGQQVVEASHMATEAWMSRVITNFIR